MDLNKLTEDIKNGYRINKNEALDLLNVDLEELTRKADELREYFCENYFDLCTIVNAKNGKCSENCKFCIQSSHYKTGIESYPLLDKESILKDALENEKKGILRYSIVTSGKRLPSEDVDKVVEIVKELKEKTNLAICVSHGLLNEEEFKKLKDAGVCRVHNNLETSGNFFSEVCTSHTHEEKIETIKAAQKVGLEVCSGGIMGLGESFEDRIDMAFEIRDLGVKSVPVNILNPIPNTPFENNEVLKLDEVKRIVAIYRFINPDAYIRLAGGRGLLEDQGKSLFSSGANAAISGDMLNTAGITTETDIAMVEELEYKVEIQ